MNCLYSKFIKNFLALALLISSAFIAPVSCIAEENPSAPVPDTSNQQQTPVNDNNSQSSKPIKNKKENKKPETLNQPPESENTPPPSQEASPSQEQTPKNENPSVKSKKVPVKKAAPPAKKDDTEKAAEKSKSETSAEETKISLPDVLPEDISPLNSVSPTYNQEESGNNFIKSIISWVLIAIGVVIILFVIISNRKVPSDSSNLFQGRHDLKTNLKHSKNYDKNIRRK